MALGWLAGKAVGHPEAGAVLGYQAGPYLASPSLMKTGINAANSLQAPAFGLLNAAPAAGRILGPRLLNQGLLNGQ